MSANTETGQLSGGELIARCLAAEGIELLFGLPCPEIEPLLVSLDDNGIRFFPVRHEAAAVHMAEGVYKTTGRVAAVIGNPGPGSANLVPGVVTAMHEGVPVLVMTAQHRLGLVYPSTPATFQGQDQLDLFRSTVKWGGPVFEWSRIPEVMRMAFRHMLSGRPGPVHLELPAPIIAATGDAASAPVWPPGRSRAPLSCAPARQVDAVTALLAGASRPMIVSGAGVDRAGAAARLLELVELLNCPVITTTSGRATFPFDHPNVRGGYGEDGDRARREADVVLVLGSRMGNVDLPFDKYWGPAGACTLVQVDVEAANIGVSRPVDLAVVSDVSSFLDLLLTALRERGVNRRGAQEMDGLARESSAYWQAMLADTVAWKGEGIHPAHALAIVGEVFGDEPVYQVDGGMTSLWAGWFLPATRPRSYHGITELGMLGTGVPAAVGARLADPDREVLCLTGDGAAGFNFMELQSAAREGVDITVVVFAEGSWTMEEPSELAAYGRTFGTEMGEVRWDRVAEGLGAYGEYVDRLDELAAALTRAREHRGPAVVCLRTSVEANRAVPGEMFQRFFEVYWGPMA
ncbi:MAG: thiamine pyrophosphate-binding protein [Proteobacteria bacterium]|nr:thiamine pyrophosphate-binding protein [Pseudomonadota bacterium]